MQFILLLINYASREHTPPLSINSAQESSVTRKISGNIIYCSIVTWFRQYKNYCFPFSVSVTTHAKQISTLIEHVCMLAHIYAVCVCDDNFVLRVNKWEKNRRSEGKAKSTYNNKQVRNKYTCIEWFAFDCVCLCVEFVVLECVQVVW